MSNYTKMKVHLSEGQIRKLKSAVTLQIDKSKTPNYDIYLTKRQINQINKGKRITIDKTQLKTQLETEKKCGGALFKDILNQINPEILNELMKFLDIPKILKVLQNYTFGSGKISYSNIKKSILKQNGGFLPFFNILDKFKKQQSKLFGGFLPFLIPILTSLGLGAASGVGAWGTKKVLDKMSGSGSVYQTYEKVEGSGCKKTEVKKTEVKKTEVKKKLRGKEK